LSGLLIGIVVVIIAAAMIVRSHQPQTVLLVTGLILLALAATFFADHYLVHQKLKTTGWT